MGTPSAALSIQPPPNPLDQYAKLVSLKSVLGQQQLQQQQLQGAQMQNQQTALNLRSQQAFMHAFAQPVDWNDPDAIQGVLESAAQNGATPQALMNFNNTLLDQRNKLATLDKTQLETHQQQNDELRGNLDSIIGAKDPQQKAILWKSGVDNAISKGWLQPGQITDVYPGDAAAQVLANHLALGSVLVKEATAQQDANARAQAAATGAQRLADEAPGISADNAVKQAQANAVKQNGLAGITPALADAQYRALIEQERLHARGMAPALSPQQQAYKEAYEAQKTLVPKFNFTLQSGEQSNFITPGQESLHGQQFLQTVNPQDQATLRALATGRIEFPSSFALRTPYWERMTALLNQYDPGFSEQRAQLRKAFLVSGKSADNIRALNTAAAHLDTLGGAAQALGNGSFRPGNAAWNAIRNQFGATAPTNFNSIKNAVVGEMANALKGSATDQEIENIGNEIKASSSPAQLQAIINSSEHILSQKLGTYTAQYQQQNPGDALFSPVLPNTQQIFTKYGVGSEPNRQAGPQPQAAPRPTIVGPNGHTLVLSADGKSWVAPGGGN